MAARNAPYGEPGTAQWALRREALGSVIRTGGLKPTTGPQQRGEGELVKPDERKQEARDEAREETHGANFGGFPKLLWGLLGFRPSGPWSAFFRRFSACIHS